MAITISGTTGIAGVDGSAGTPAVQGTDTNTGIYYSAADTVDVATGGVQRGQFDSSGNFKFNSGYGSVATAYGCRAWVNFNGTGTVAIRASGNVTSITDNGVGDYTVNFTTAMSDANYAVSLGSVTFSNVNSTTGLFIQAGATSTVPSLKSTTQIRVIYSNFAAPQTNYDCSEVNVAIFR